MAGASCVRRRLGAHACAFSAGLTLEEVKTRVRDSIVDLKTKLPAVAVHKKPSAPAAPAAAAAAQ